MLAAAKTGRAFSAENENVNTDNMDLGKMDSVRFSRDLSDGG